MSSVQDSSASRRRFLRLGGALAAAVAASQAKALAQAVSPASSPEVSPLEDLMREHGLLSRILLIYDEVRRRLDSGAQYPPQVVTQAAGIVRRFVEDYHEELEGNHIFPRFEKSGRETDLVKVLRTQHEAGRRLTDLIMRSAEAGGGAPQERRQLSEYLRLFARMYRPHKARENTVLFPGLHSIVTAKEYDAMGDVFEDRERALFGEGGFEKMVGAIAGLEKQLGIYHLSAFTPKV